MKLGITKTSEDANKQAELQSVGGQMRVEDLRLSFTAQISLVANEDIEDEEIGYIVSSYSSARKIILAQSDEKDKKIILLHSG